MSSRKVYRLLLACLMGVGGQHTAWAVDLTAAPQVPVSTAAKPRITQTAQPAAKPASMQVGSAAPGALPGASPATLWQFMGIPQGIRKWQGATRNRNGNNPQREPTPPMKAIADPANLDPGNGPAINKAAEIKQKEDLAPQKIKALKYLATIGCGCYPGVEEAFAKSLKFGDECTEEVRYEAALAIQEAAESNCAKCGKSCCCTAEMMQLLNDVATGRDADGCFIEPSARVREAACQALLACRRRVQVYPAPPPEPYVPPEAPGETIPREPLPGEFVPKESSAQATGSRRTNDGNALMNDIMGVAASPVSNRKSASQAGGGDASRPAPPRILLVGSVVGIDARTGTVDLEFQGSRQPTVGSQFSVHHDYAINSVYQGRLEVVYLARNGRAIAKPVGRLDFAKLGKGDRVTGRITGDDASAMSPASHTIRSTPRASCVAPPEDAPIPQPPAESPAESTTSAPSRPTKLTQKDSVPARPADVPKKVTALAAPVNKTPKAKDLNVGKQALDSLIRPKKEMFANPWRNAVPAQTVDTTKQSGSTLTHPFNRPSYAPETGLTARTATNPVLPPARQTSSVMSAAAKKAPQTGLDFEDRTPRRMSSFFNKLISGDAGVGQKPLPPAKVAESQASTKPRKFASPIASGWSRLTKPQVGRLNPSPVAPASAAGDSQSPAAGIVLMED